MALVNTVGYTWVDGEVVTAAKLNLAATPTIADGQTYAFGSGAFATPSHTFSAESTLGFYRYGAAQMGLAGSLYAINPISNTQLQFGQDSTHNLNFLWTYNATAGSATAVFGTFGKSNDLTIQAKNLYFDSSSLAFALQIVAAGRVIVGGAADDGVNALQTSTFSASGGIKGTATNDSASAGYIGQYSSTTALGSAVAMTTVTGANATSVSLTAGDWDVSGELDYNPAGTTTTNLLAAAISQTSATITNTSDSQTQYNMTFTTGGRQLVPTPTVRVSLSGTTTLYLVAYASFAVSTATCGGTIRARRVR